MPPAGRNPAGATRARLSAAALAAAFAWLACAGPPQRLTYQTMPLPETRHVLEYAVYVPPGFTPAERLPLVVFLHGASDGPDCFDEAHVGERLDAATASGHLPRAVIVLPRGDLGFWENWADGSFRYRDWVVRDLVAEVARRYATAACPENCHLVGISMGGHGALRFALHEPARFASVTAISAPILDSDDAIAFLHSGWRRWLVPAQRIWGDTDRAALEEEDLFLRWDEPEDLHGARLMLAWGERDHARVIETNRRFDRHLTDRGIDHDVLVFEGGHNWRAWTPVLETVLSMQLGP